MSATENMATAFYEGLRVIRGKDWCWGDQDGGEGGVGTVIRGENSLNNVDITVVLWDNGNISNYRTGKYGKYDLLVYDSGPAGVHHGMLCSSCVKKLWGMKWDCSICSNVHLCGICYMTGAHDLDHTFLRHDHPNSPKGEEVPARRRSAMAELKGIFVNSRVVRGVHWQWTNQDGGEGNLGTVKEIMDLSDISGRSVAKVQWDGGAENIYRSGHLAKVDLSVRSCPWGENFCYKEHLPALCPSYVEKFNRQKLGMTTTPSKGSGARRLVAGIQEAAKSSGDAAGGQLAGNVVSMSKDESYDINRQDENGDTILHMAIQSGLDGVVRDVLSNESLIPSISNCNNEDGLQLAAKFGKTFAVEQILERWPDMARRDRQNDSALHLSCIHGNLEAARCLVYKGGASVNLASPLGFTPLHLAIENGHTDIAVFLVERGADVCRTGEGCVELALDKVVKVESTEELSGEIFEITREIRPTLLSHYPGLPLACLLARRGAPYKEQNLPQNVCQVLSDQVKNREVVMGKSMEAPPHLCVICLESKVEVAFQCGHVSCKNCSLGLRDCHMCKAPVVQKINLFF